MERDPRFNNPNVISLNAYRTHTAQEAAPESRPSAMQLIARVRRQTNNLLLAARQHLATLSEDAHVSRNDALDRITFLADLIQAVKMARPGARVDLSREV